MKKAIKAISIIVVAIVLIIAFFIILPLLKPDIVPRDWQVYENSRYSFSVKFPANWQLGEPETNNAGRELFSSDEKIQCYAYGFQNVIITEDGNTQTLEEFIEWLKEGLDIRVIKEKEGMLGEYRAIELISEEGNKIKHAIYALGQDTGRGLFCIFESQEAREGFQLTFNKMIKSFKINVSLDENQ